MARVCVALFSGGLDSTLALRLMTVQGIETVAFHARNCFHGTADRDAREALLRRRALDLGAREFVVGDLTADVIALVNRPPRGHGKNLNPCLDCRIGTIRGAKRLADEIGADFVVAGEVLGQRPMSQRRDAMRTTDREVVLMGLGDRFLRPLCAKLFDPTLPEREGWVDRGRLRDFSGRDRKPQLALAAELGITEFPSPAGGCLLTDPGYSARLADMMLAMGEDWTARDAELLKIGRHYRLGPRTKVVVSRTGEENGLLEAWLPSGAPVFAAAVDTGALAAVCGEVTPEAEAFAAAAAVRFSRNRTAERAPVARWRHGIPGTRAPAGEFAPAVDSALEAVRVAAAGRGRRDISEIKRRIREGRDG